MEMSSNNPQKCDPLQLAAALIDKDTLDIKEEYCTLIKPHTDDWEIAAANVHGLNRNFLLKAGEKHTKVFNEFSENFDLDVLRLSSWNIFDIEVLRRFTQRGINNLHKIIELWSFTYPYFLVNNIELPKEKVHGLTYVCDYFGINRINAHDALDDVRVEAKILKLVIEYYKAYNVEH
tara:strand:+ start:226 stop:756 length:531 start_codon:yes stop_codon:yes gene_type:complete